MSELYLAKLDLHAALQLAALEDARHLAGDRAQEVDVPGIESALLDRLHVEHPDQSWARFDRHRQHRSEAVLVEARHPLPVRLLADVGDDRRPAGLGHPACDAFADPHRRLAHHLLVEAVGRGEEQLAPAWGDQVQRTHVGAHGRRRLADDELEQLIRFLRRCRRLGEPDQEAQLALSQAAFRFEPFAAATRHDTHTAQLTVAHAIKARVKVTTKGALVSVTDTGVGPPNPYEYFGHQVGSSWFVEVGVSFGRI